MKLTSQMNLPHHRLRLERAKGPRESLVIDYVEKQSEN